jgi:hypothetical protein
MEHSRSYLTDECEETVSGTEPASTIITPALAPSSCRRKQASLRGTMSQRESTGDRYIEAVG